MSDNIKFTQTFYLKVVFRDLQKSREDNTESSLYVRHTSFWPVFLGILEVNLMFKKRTLASVPEN